MIITSAYITTLLTVTGVLAVLGGIALFIYTVLNREREFQEKEKKTFTEYNQVLANANEQAAQILEATVATSQRLLAETRTTNESLIVDINKVLQQMAEKQIHTLGTETVTLEKEYEKQTAQIEQLISESIERMLKNAEAGINKQLINLTASLDTKTQQLLTNVEEEISEYKKLKLQKLDADIMKLVQKTYQDVLGRSIPENVQQELIIEALEKAKEEGVFANV